MAAWLAGLTLLLFAGLFPLGHWYSDEYDIFHDMALQGGAASWHRFWVWSPRPVSELLIHLYGRLVLATGRAWIPELLLFSLLWLLAAATMPLWRVAVGAGRHWLPLTLTVCAMCLSGHAVARVFYWPVASLAYVLTLAGVMGVFAEHLRPGAQVRSWVCGGWLLLAALSSEIGAMFALIHGLLSLCRSRRGGWALLPSLLGAGLVLGLMLSHRAGGVVEQIPGAGPVHQLWSSLRASVTTSWPHLWFAAGDAGVAATLQVVSKLALLGAAAGLAVGQGLPLTRRRGLWVLAAGAAAMVPATIFAAWYQFGQLCCEHHDTVRQCFMVLALAAFGAGLGLTLEAAGCSAPLLQRLAPWLLCLALGTALAVSAPPMWADYRQYAQRYRLQQENWASGEAADPQLTIRQWPPGRLTGGSPPMPAGSFGDGVPVPAGPDHQRRFFGKRTVRVEAPSVLSSP